MKTYAIDANDAILIVPRKAVPDSFQPWHLINRSLKNSITDATHANGANPAILELRTKNLELRTEKAVQMMQIREIRAIRFIRDSDNKNPVQPMQMM